MTRRRLSVDRVLSRAISSRSAARRKQGITLARTQGTTRFSADVLTNPSGFAGIDGLFRFRADGTNERGLAVMKVTTGGGVAVAGSPKSFGA